MNKQRVLTGIRPTGPLHLGHYAGALKQWLNIQNAGNHDCYFLIADVQALTTHVDKPGLIEQSVREIVLDWLAVGLDPSLPHVHFVMQSWLRELPELTVYLSMVAPFTWMQHNPTIRAEMKTIKAAKEAISTGFMMYPVSQAADILFVSPDPTVYTSKILVPVGQDQAPHLEDTNRIAKRFGDIYGDTFVRCSPLFGDVSRLVGTDGQAKMSKSLGNAIVLCEELEDLRKKVMKMYTDPTRIRATDPGHVEGNPVFMYLDAFDPNTTEVQDLKERYEQGRVGDVAVKGVLLKALTKFLGPIQERRGEAEKEDLLSMVTEGTEAARILAVETLERVREAMHLNYKVLRRLQ